MSGTTELTSKENSPLRSVSPPPHLLEERLTCDGNVQICATKPYLLMSLAIHHGGFPEDNLSLWAVVYGESWKRGKVYLNECPEN